MKTKRTRGMRQRRRGAALVEMAVCLPVLVMVILAIIEFGGGMMVAELLNDAARVVLGRRSWRDRRTRP